MIIEILLTIIVALLLVLIFLKKGTNESSIIKILNDSGLFTKIGELSNHAQNITNYAQNLTSRAEDINRTLDTKIESLTVQAKDMNETLDKKVGELTTHTEDIRQSHKSIEQMLRVPKERAPFGELSLEIILSDQLPPDMFGIRQKILDGKIPDAYIRSTVGLICIDSKFPLDNYAKMIETQNLQEKEDFKKQFIKDVEGHLDKIYYNYVCPQKGSAEFAFAYIPSEGVYYFLMTEAYQMLLSYTKKGVQMASPLFLSSKIELIKTGVQAKKLSEDTEKVRNDIIRLSQQFKDIDESWRLFYGTHFSRAVVKAGEVDQGYKKLREEFGKISKLTDKKVVYLEQPITTIPSDKQHAIIAKPSIVASDKDRIIKEKRIVEGKIRKVDTFNGNIVRVFDDDGRIIEDRSIKLGDKPLIDKDKENILIQKNNDVEKDETYEEFTKFYDDFMKQIMDGITTSKTGEIAAPINNIIEDSKKMIPTVEGKEKELLRGMKIFFDMRGINTKVIDDDYMTFKRRCPV